MPDCKFYGCHAVLPMRLLIESRGNQCALITTAYAPCQMEVQGLVPDWSRCPLNTDELGQIFDGFTRTRL